MTTNTTRHGPTDHATLLDRAQQLGVDDLDSFECVDCGDAYCPSFVHRMAHPGQDTLAWEAHGVRVECVGPENGQDAEWYLIQDGGA